MAQSNKKSVLEHDVLVGETPLLNGYASLKKVPQFNAGKSAYVLSYQDQNDLTEGGIQSHQFLATTTEFETLYETIKSVFKTKQKKTVVLSENVILQLSMLTDSDLQFLVIVQGVKQGEFSVSAAGLSFLFGKRWEKGSWKSYLKS